MGEVSGTQLSESWDAMEIDDKAEIIDQLVGIEKKLLSVTFSS